MREFEKEKEGKEKEEEQPRDSLSEAKEREKYGVRRSAYAAPWRRKISEEHQRLVA